MHLSNGNARNLSPSLVGVGVVVKKFVTKHECHSQQSVLTAWLAFDSGISLLEPVYEKESEENDILRNLSRRKYCCDPFPKACRWNSFWLEGRQGKGRRRGIFRKVECFRALKPEQASNLACGQRISQCM